MSFEHRLPVLFCDLYSGLCESETRIIYQYEFSVVVLDQPTDSLRERANLVDLPHVGRSNLGVASVSRDSALDLYKLLSPSTREHHSRTGPGKTFGEGTPNSFTRTGYDDQTIVKSEGRQRIIDRDFIHRISRLCCRRKANPNADPTIEFSL
jgi:hypothetical protein